MKEMQEVDLNYYSERRWRSRIPDEGDDLVKSCEVMSCHVMSCHVKSSLSFQLHGDHWHYMYAGSLQRRYCVGIN